MESNTNAEIQGAKAASRNLSSKLNKLDQESLKQQEIVYNQVSSSGDFYVTTSLFYYLSVICFVANYICFYK